MKTTIADLQKKYAGKIDRLDLDVLIAAEIKQSREFVLTYPEYALPPLKIKALALKIARRRCDEPLAYILGHREFFGLSFAVTSDTLIPRPETELMVEMALQEIRDAVATELTVVDVGTGSGNIIISLAKKIETDKLLHASCYMLYGVDISPAALAVAKKNARANQVAKKITFLHGNLLEPVIKNLKLPASDRRAVARFDPMRHLFESRRVSASRDGKIKNSRIIILANLPYLSQEIYAATHPTVQKYEPRSALYSADAGLAHYAELLQQIKTLKNTQDLLHVTCYMEISPEQKTKLSKIIKAIVPKAKFEFHKDLAQKWRLCQIIP
jgi:release factor glutamine methyltransferase